MAKRRRRVEDGHDVAGGLANPWPSPPSRLPTHYIRIECEGRKFDTTFSAAYAAWHFLDAIVGDGDFKWLSHERISTSEGVIVYSPELEEIVEYDPTPEEEAWEIPPIYKWQCFYVATGRKLKRKSTLDSQSSSPQSAHSRPGSPSPHPPDGERRGTTASGGPTAGGGNEARRNSGDGTISISEICERIGMEPSRARRILRARADLAHLPKGRWSWDARDVDAIIAILQK